MASKSLRPAGHLALLSMTLLASAVAAAAESPATEPTAAGTAGASAASRADSTELERVVVTARRRDELAQHVPTAVSAISGEQLETQRVSQVQDIQQLVPSLNAPVFHARQSSLAVRGIGNSLANEGLEGSVGVYLDNVYLGRPGMAVQDLLDIAQVDLLRGPQGTLFGKNTTAGVLNIQSRQPSSTPERVIEVSAGERGYQQLRGVLSGPLNEQWAGRLQLSKTHDDGWTKNLHDGRKLNSIDREGVRGQLLFKGDNDFSLRLIADYATEDDSQGTPVIIGVGPALAGYRNLHQGAAANGVSPSPSGKRTRTVNLDGPQSLEAEQGGLSAEANWKVSDYSLTSVTAYRFWDFAPHNDVDGTSASVIADYGFKVSDQQWSQEFRLASPVGERFDYVLGAFLFRQDISNRLYGRFGPDADRALLPSTAIPVGGGVTVPLNSGAFNVLNNVESVSRGQVTTSSYALFAQSNWHVNERVDLTTGAWT